MKLITFILLLSAMLTRFNAAAQASGNSAYGANYYYGKQPAAEKLYLTDSTFIIEASVAMNVIADAYVATFGLSEEAASLKESNERIDKRIQSFVSDLTKKGIAQADLYIDMTSQNKIYDYNVTGDAAEQYLKGFEIKKNVTLRLKNMKDLDDIIVLAGNYQIYDLVKVDYIVTDLNKVYNQLFQTATNIIQQKKVTYTAATNNHLAPSATIYNEQFYSFYPDQLYKSYTAYESSDVYNNDYNNNYTRKDLRKSATIYYDKINYSGFDQIINPVVIEPAVEFVLTLDIKFNTVRS